MADKLPILLFKIVITLLISFKAESQVSDEDPNLKEFEQLAKDFESNPPQQFNIEDIDDPNRKEFEQIIKDFESNPPQQFNINNIDYNNLKEFEQLAKDLESNPPQQFNIDNIDDNLEKLKQLAKDLDSIQPQQFGGDYTDEDLDKLQKIVDDEKKMTEELSKLDVKQFEFKPQYGAGFSRFKASDIPYLIIYGIAYVAAAFVFSSLLILIAHCIKKRRSRQSPNTRLSLWLFSFKNTDSDDEKQTSGDGSGPLESKGDKTRLIPA